MSSTKSPFAKVTAPYNAGRNTGKKSRLSWHLPALPFIVAADTKIGTRRVKGSAPPGRRNDSLKIFTALYDRVLRWAAHPRAERYLAGLSFAESSFFPIPPDVMLAPMTLAKPKRGWRFATVTTIASVAGGLAGYAIGWLALDAFKPLLMSLGYWDGYVRATEWFVTWGFLAVLAAGFSPIPYKVFTISAGALAMAFVPFVLASALGRGARFFLVAWLLAWGGANMEARIRSYVETIGWVLVVAGIIAYLAVRG